jgi:hypothetical protein
VSQRLREAALVVGGFTAIFVWLYAKPFLEHSLLAESDLYEYYLPVFLAPITIWSPFEFSGLPAFADPGDFAAYPPHFLFGLIGSWTGLTVSAFVLAAGFTYAYVRHVTGSPRAAWFAGLAYGLSEALMERVPHSSTLHAAAWLPLMILAVERQHGAGARRWIAAGAVAVGCCFLAGHPQPAIYMYYCVGLYAVVSGLVQRAGLAFYGRVAAIFTLGAGLTLIKGLPFVEASFYMERQAVNFGQFASHSNTPAQMLSMLFPSILHEGREAPTFVGLITLGLAIVAALVGWKGSWRVRFFVALAVVTLLLGMGDSTPISQVAFYIPLYWKFRVVARHLILAAFALCVLAGLGVAACERGAVSRRAALTAALTLAGVTLAAAALLLARPDLFTYEIRAPLPFPMPGWNSGVWVQLAIAAMTVLCLLASARAGARKAWWILPSALLVADAIYSLPYPITLKGLDPITIPAGAAAPSVHARRLAASVAPMHQRLLAPGGTHRDDVVPAAWARVWQIPIAGGYGPMLLESQSELGRMATNGSVIDEVLAPNALGLDLLAVRRIIMRADALQEPPTFEAEGLRWSSRGLDVTAGRDDCNHRYPRTLSLPLPAVDIREIAIVGHLRCAEDVPNGAAVAQVSLQRGDDAAFQTTWHAGVEIADQALANEAVARRAKHGVATVFRDPDADPNEYLIRLRPPAPMAADRLVLDVPPMSGWVAIDRITVVDAAGASHPLSTPTLFLSDSRRWREVERFRTSRTSDRDRDDPASDETEFVVYENARARPGAWLVPEVVTLPRPDLVAALRHGELPDGRRFDPATTALLMAEAPAPSRRFDAAPAEVTLRTIGDGRASIDVSSGGGFLVWSEAYYPGWQATVDGQPVEVRRTNLHLQGVEVPAGRHRVEFSLHSRTLQLGTLVSAMALAACLGLALVPSRTRPTPPPGPAPA